MSGFLAETIHTHMAILAEFSNSTWLLILVYVCTTSSSLFLCAQYRHLTLALDVLWYCASAYLCYRLLLHAATLRQTAREQEQERRRTHRPSGRPPRPGWPAEWVDWLLFPFIGPGVTGFVPCRPRPSEIVGMRCLQVCHLPRSPILPWPFTAFSHTLCMVYSPLQAMLWVHFYRLGEYLTDPFRRHAHVQHVVMEALVNLLPKLVFLLLWALWIVPGMLEVFSLPPFLDDLEHSLLLHTLTTYPNGLPADDMLVARSGQTSPKGANGASAGTNGAPAAERRAPRTPHAVSEYVLLKAQRREDSRLFFWEQVKSGCRWVVGLPPLRDPGQRLAAHYQWIHTDRDEDGPGGAAAGGADGSPSHLAPTCAGPGRPSTPIPLPPLTLGRSPSPASLL